MAGKAKGKSSRIVVWIILILLVVGLAGFGATSFNGQLRSVGKVGDTEISISRYSRELQQELRAISAQAGQNLTLSQARQFGIDQAVLQRLIATAAMENETTRIGLSVGDEEVRKQLLITPAFQGLNGEFDREAYEFTLERAGLTPAGYEETMRADAAASLLEGAVSSGLSAPATYADTILGFVGERRNFSWVELDRAALDEPLPTAAQADIRAYYDANSENFMLPEARRLTYAWLSPDNLTDQIEPDEDALRALYEERDSEYNKPERRLIERLVFGTGTEAQAAFDSIAAGDSSFAEAVTARGLALADVDLGDVTRDALGSAGNAVFALTGPGMVGPVETDLGPALFRVNAILVASETRFEDVRDTLHEEYAADAARRLIANQISELDDLLAGGATLEELADETDMVLGQIDWSVGQSEGIAAYDGFASAALQITPEDFPAISELEDGGVFALRLDDVVAAHPEPFEDASDRVQTAWELSETMTRLTGQGEALKTQLDEGLSISALGLPTTVETQILRSTFIEGAPASLLISVFDLEPGETAVLEGTDTVLVAQLADILPPDTKNPDIIALRDTINGETAQGIGQDVLSAFAKAVQATAGISLDQAALNAVHAQFP